MTGLTSGQFTLLVAALALMSAMLCRMHPFTQPWSKWLLIWGGVLLFVSVILLVRESS